MLKKITFCLTILFLASTVQAKTYEYIAKTEMVETKSTLAISEIKEGFLVETKWIKGTSQIYARPDLSTYYYSYVGPAKESKVTIERDDNNLIFSGTTEAGPVACVTQIDKAPWYGTPFFLKNFILSRAKEIEFHMVVAYDQGAMKFLAIKEQEETVKHKGKDVKTIKVKMTFPDWRSMFWASYYWFRKSDGVLLTTKETRGAPGTPETIMTLELEK